MKNRSRFRNYISVQALTMILILGVRLTMPKSPDLVTLLSFCLYFVSTAGILIWELRQSDFRRYLTVYATLAFLLVGILPVLALRVTHWGDPFEFVSLLAMPGVQWERIGNLLFMAVLIAHFVDSTRMRMQSLKESPPQN